MRRQHGTRWGLRALALALSLILASGAVSVAESYRTLRKGDEGETVREMQTALNALGYSVGLADGKFGEATLRAVVKFQEAQLLKADGAAGTLTLTRLYALYSQWLGGATPAPAAATATPTPVHPTATPASTTIPEYSERLSAYVNTRSGSLNLRDTPRSGAKILARIPKGASIVVLQSSGIWCVAEYAGLTGYVMREYIQFSGSAPSATPFVPTATPTPAVSTATPAPAQQGQTGTVSTSGGYLNLRDAAKRGSNVIAQIPNGASVQITQILGEWSAAIYAGQYGYVMTSFIRLGGSATAAPTAADLTPAPTATPTATPAAASTSARVVAPSGSLNLRDAASKSSNVITTIPSGTIISVSANMGTWAAVQYQNVSGYVMTQYLTFDVVTPTASPSPTPPSAEATPSPTPGYLTLRTGMTGDEVTRMQNALAALKYECPITGTFDSDTRQAVIAFQQRNSLASDGIAGALTLAALYGDNPKDADTELPKLPEGAGKIDAPSAASVQLLHWFNEVKPALSSRSLLLVYDPATDLGWTLRVYSRGRHSDSEPLTLTDTQIMNRAFGNITTWTPKAVYVKLPDGRWTLATMHNTPHLSGSIADNGFDGHLCVHFLRDLDECAANDPNYGMQHQRKIRSAWYAMTGITVE